ncbi:MAG: GNAT family N-acetyltransferase [Chloroflexi bacterium]|nr:GNAT family N-acetyltransferase [Chloroflexota bacterium]
MITIRPANPDTDYDRVADLLNLIEVQPVTATTIRGWDRREGFTLRREVAVTDDADVIGYSVAAHAPWVAAQRFAINVVVDPDWRCRGVGAALYDHALTFARENGANFLDAEVREDDPAALRFAQQRSFRVDHHLFESRIDLKSFDERPFVSTLDEVLASGIRIYSLADVGDTMEERRQLWSVNCATSLTDPASDGTFPGFDEMMDIWNNAEWFTPAGQFLAVAGDEPTGMAAVGYFRQTNSFYNMMTGVLPDFRGRKIAQALKLVTIRFAREQGAAYIATNNASNNAPMLAINRKLGYIPRPGLYRLVNPAV